MKIYKQRDGRPQHTICVRLDEDNYQWLQNFPNKNRVVNECIDSMHRAVANRITELFGPMSGAPG